MPFIPTQCNQFYEEDKGSNFILNGDINSFIEVLDSSNIFRLLFFLLIEEHTRNVINLLENNTDNQTEGNANQPPPFAGSVNRFANLFNHFNDVIPSTEALTQQDSTETSENRLRRHRRHHHEHRRINDNQ